MNDSPAEDIGVAQGRWFETVRRADLGRELKFAAILIGSYASAEGRGIFPGTARLAVDLDCSYRTAQRHLAELCRLGLLERVRRVRVRGKSDVYRLVLAVDLLEKVKLPSPSEYRAAIAEVAEKNRRGRSTQSVPDIKVSGTDSGTGQQDLSVPDTDPPTTSDDAHPPTNERDTPTRGKAPTTQLATQPETRTCACAEMMDTPPAEDHEPPLAAVPDTKRTHTKPLASAARRGRQLPLVAAVTPEPDEDDPVRPHLRELLDRPADRPTTPTATGPDCPHCDVVLDPDQQCRNPTCHPTAPSTAPPTVDECACGVLLDPDRVCRNPTHASTG